MVVWSWSNPVLFPPVICVEASSSTPALLLAGCEVSSVIDRHGRNQPSSVGGGHLINVLGLVPTTIVEVDFFLSRTNHILLTVMAPDM